MKDEPIAKVDHPTTAKRRCTVTVTEAGWYGSKVAAKAVGCSSISDLLEKLGRGQLAVVSSDDGVSTEQEFPFGARKDMGQPLLGQVWLPAQRFYQQLSKLAITGTCAALILLPLLYVVDLTLPDPITSVEVTANGADGITTGDTIAGYPITDHFRIRPVHPVTGAKNVPHNGVDVATPVGTPIYAVGQVGDQVTVKCWWDEDGGGWVANQTATSYPDYVFQSLHLQAKSCLPGQAQAGDVIARTGNSGLGTGEHYDFRIKIRGQYVPPEKPFLEAALTGKSFAKQRRRFW